MLKLANRGGSRKQRELHGQAEAEKPQIGVKLELHCTLLLLGAEKVAF